MLQSIKDRVLLISKSKGNNKMDFFKDLGMSYANFKGVQKKSALSSDAVATILSIHKDISPAWLIAGEGDMYREGACLACDKQEVYQETSVAEKEQVNYDPLQRIISSQEITIKSQEKTIFSLEKQIALLEREIAQLRKD